MEAATNTAFAASRGEFIAILDDDDTWDPGFLQTTVSHLDAHPEQVAVATRADVVVESLDDEGRPTEIERRPFATQWSSWNLVDLLAKNYIPINSELVRADAARRAVRRVRCRRKSPACRDRTSRFGSGRRGTCAGRLFPASHGRTARS